MTQVGPAPLTYILEGRGMISDLTTDESWPLESGTMYIVGPDDRHSMEAILRSSSHQHLQFAVTRQ
ncbi:MAG: ectoine synthase [Gammaproteobacteria bacterium]